jgi:hypothetical protein
MMVETGEEMVEVATSEGPVEYRALAVSVPRRGEWFQINSGKYASAFNLLPSIQEQA